MLSKLSIRHVITFLNPELPPQNQLGLAFVRSGTLNVNKFPGLASDISEVVGVSCSRLKLNLLSDLKKQPWHTMGRQIGEGSCERSF